MNLKVFNKKVKKLFLFSDDLIDKILNVIYIKQDEKRKNVVINDEDITLINIMINYLAIYDGANLSFDFYKKFNNNLSKEIEFYIYFIYLYMKWTCDKNIFTDLFLKNVNTLYYLNDIESFYNPEKFKLHYAKPFLDNVNIEKEPSDNIISYVMNNLPNNLNTDLEKAIAIYILLSKVLTYSPVYTLHEDYEETNDYSNVTVDNNEVVCIQFSIIYHKILEIIGIDSNLAGNINTHMYVNLSFGNMMIRADATRYGFYDDKFNLSDMTNLKYNFLLEGFRIYPTCYGDPSYVKFCESKLEDIIKEVYIKMNLPLDRKEKLYELIYKFQKREFGIGKEVNKSDIDRRVEELNSLPTIVNGKVEDTQFYNMLVTGFFFDIAEERVENISFYKYVNGDIILTKMLVVYDEKRTPYYYFFRDGKLTNFSVDDIIDIILNEGWLFKYQTDIDALYISDDRIYSLMR